MITNLAREGKGNEGEAAQDGRRIGARIRARREYLGLTQRDLAGFLSVTPASYGKYESGDIALSALDAARIARRLGVVVGYLYDDEAERSREQAAYAPILDELHYAGSNGGLAEDDVDEIAEYIRMKARRRAIKAQAARPARG